VPELPRDEAQSGGLSLPQLLAQHRANRACAGCHQRFDSLGLASEGYGPIGERRLVDLGGRPVESRVSFPDGSTGAGLEGLQSYLARRRQRDFVDNLCRKMFAYALGRSPVLSDKIVIDKMSARLAADGYPMQTLIEAIVTSPQFLNQRGQDASRR
jgi:hypothetical protein